MTILKIEQNAVGDDEYTVNASLTIDGQAPQSANARFRFAVTPQDREDIRWYLEDYLQYPMNPAPKIAARIENRMEEIGGELFDKLFQAESGGHDLWVEIRNRMSDLRVEISTGVAEAASIPWELLREPDSDTPIAISVRELVRANFMSSQTPKHHTIKDETIRILFVICRSGKKHDVPFRSVAGRIIKNLNRDDLKNFHFDMLRPPTYARLSEVLQAAKDAGEPYHVVHFDGHGVYENYDDMIKASKEPELVNEIFLSPPPKGFHGYLAFENPGVDDNTLYVDGTRLGQLLYDNDVSALILNACRSAHSDAQPEPEKVKGDAPGQSISFGSLAQEVVDAGVPGVVAMRYNVYVVTAAQFVADLYTGLMSGQSLGEAVSSARKQLKENPMRTIAFDPRPLRDWVVPIVYETAPIKLFRKQAHPRLVVEARPAKKDAAETGLEAEQLSEPEVGFFGRDETILALDRAFDTRNAVLLHAYAGSGKTTTAGEFARWYAKTGGVDGPVLFNSFQFKTTLSGVLAHLGMAFETELQRKGKNWSALDTAGQRATALELLREIPVLWIWDNVEPITGFPKETDSQWSKPQQNELLEFLRDASQTKAKFLLTSRRRELRWLKSLAFRMPLPPMPLREMVEFTRAIADKHGTRLSSVEDWKPLLEFTQGNPMTLRVLVGQTFRNGLSSRAQIEAFVDKLCAGEAEFDDDEEQGRSKSLGASLKYGFENTFSEDELKILALLYFFQGFVDADVLRIMGDSGMSWRLPEVRGLTEEEGIALLDRAAEIGLLTVHSEGFYSIHPAIPWFFKNIYDRYYTTPEHRLAATRAFVEAMSDFGSYYHNQFGAGDSYLIYILDMEEANLLHSRRLALANRWLHTIVKAMQGLCTLYDHTGRHMELARLVEEIVPDFTDMKTDRPLPALEEEWSIVTQYRILLDRENKRLKEAERLQIIRIEVDRKLAAPFLSMPPQELDDTQRNTIRSLETSLNELGEIQRELGNQECVKAYEEIIELAKRMDDKQAEAIAAHNLGGAYEGLPDIRNLDESERWYNHSLKLTSANDNLGRAQCYGELGCVAYERFQDAKSRENPDTNQMRKYLETAASFYHQAIELTPGNAINDLAVYHHQLGIIYSNAAMINKAKKHFDEAIRYDETSGNLHGSGETRENVAVMYYRAKRFPDALDYAHAALSDYEKYGEHAAKSACEKLSLQSFAH